MPGPATAVGAVYTRPVTDVPTQPSEPARPRSATPKSPANRDLGMRATLLFPDREIVERYYVPLIYTACRTCYSELEPQDIFERATSGQVAEEKQQELVRRVIDSGHGSTIEHIVFTFAISGVTRTLSHQLVRHRAGTAFDQQSQRYVSFKKRDNFTVPDSITKGDLPDDLAGRFQRAVDENLDLYGQLLQAESLIELRLSPERLTGEIADFLDQCWKPRRRSGAGRSRRVA